MKEFFGTNITTNKRNKSFDGETFAARSAHEAAEKYDEAVEAAHSALKKQTLPGWWHRTSRILYFAGIICIALFITQFLGDANFADVISEKPLLLGGGIILFLLGGVAMLYEKMKQLTPVSPVSNRVEERQVQHAVNLVNTELGVPANAKHVDTLLYYYKNIDGENMPINKLGAEFMNFDTYLFTEKDMLCICDVENRYEIPLKDIHSIVRVESPCSLMSWNRSESPYEGLYMETGLHPDKYKRISSDYWYRMLFSLKGEKFELSIMPYDLVTYLDLTGLQVK